MLPGMWPALCYLECGLRYVTWNVACAASKACACVRCGGSAMRTLCEASWSLAMRTFDEASYTLMMRTLGRAGWRLVCNS